MIHPYARADYAGSLTHIGEAFAVDEWGGQVLARPTPDGRHRDAMGTYPLTVIAAEADVAGGLERMRAAGLVSVVLVLDDRLRPSLDRLASAFDFVRPFKSHHLHDPGVGPVAYAKHHRYEVRRAHARAAAAEIDLADHLPAWASLYAQLAARHAVGSLHAFADGHHAALARLPGVRTFGAFVEDRLVAAHLFVLHDGYAVSHLAASSAEGYETGAAYAVNDLAVAVLGGAGMTINFGGGAGFVDDPADGLVRFKKGFANTTAASYLCGKVLDPTRYRAMSAGYEAGGFFPAYRGVRQKELVP